MIPDIWIENSFNVQPMFRWQSSYLYNESEGIGKSILFAGCSITANVGLKNSPDEGWSSFLIEMIKSDLEVSCVNNCSISGASTFEIISNIFRFLNLYSKPDIIFLLLPPVQRENNAYTRHVDAAKVMDYNIFHILDTYCKQNNIDLFASTWDFYIQGITSWFVDDTNNDLVNKTLKNFDSFFYPNKEKFKKDVFEASLYGKLSLEGTQQHPSEPIHVGYAKMFYEEYKKRKC